MSKLTQVTGIDALLARRAQLLAERAAPKPDPLAEVDAAIAAEKAKAQDAAELQRLAEVAELRLAEVAAAAEVEAAVDVLAAKLAAFNGVVDQLRQHREYAHLWFSPATTAAPQDLEDMRARRRRQAEAEKERAEWPKPQIAELRLALERAKHVERVTKAHPLGQPYERDRAAQGVKDITAQLEKLEHPERFKPQPVPEPAQRPEIVEMYERPEGWQPTVTEVTVPPSTPYAQ